MHDYKALSKRTVTTTLKTPSTNETELMGLKTRSGHYDTRSGHYDNTHMPFNAIFDVPLIEFLAKICDIFFYFMVQNIDSGCPLEPLR